MDLSRWNGLTVCTMGPLPVGLLISDRVVVAKVPARQSIAYLQPQRVIAAEAVNGLFRSVAFIRKDAQ